MSTIQKKQARSSSKFSMKADMETYEKPVKKKKGILPTAYYDAGKVKDMNDMKQALQEIIPGMSSFQLFNCGTLRKTLSAIDSALADLSMKSQFRFGKDIWTQDKKEFKGIVMHRLNLR